MTSPIKRLAVSAAVAAAMGIRQPIPCACGKGHVIVLEDGTESCTATVTKYEAMHGPFPCAFEVKMQERQA